MRPQRHQDALHMTLKIKYEHSENIPFNNCYGLLIGPAPPSGGPPCATVLLYEGSIFALHKLNVIKFSNVLNFIGR